MIIHVQIPILTLRPHDLERLIEELLEQEFGDNIAAREEVRRVADEQALAEKPWHA